MGPQRLRVGPTLSDEVASSYGTLGGRWVDFGEPEDYINI